MMISLSKLAARYHATRMSWNTTTACSLYHHHTAHTIASHTHHHHDHHQAQVHSFHHSISSQPPLLLQQQQQASLRHSSSSSSLIPTHNNNHHHKKWTHDHHLHHQQQHHQQIIKSFDSSAQPFRSEHYHVLRKINRSLYVKAPWNASRQVFIYLKRHEEFLGHSISSDKDIPTWLNTDLVSRICADFVHCPPLLMHRFISEMSKVSESLVDERVINRLVQSYSIHFQLDSAFAVAFGREVSNGYTIHKVFQPDLIMLCSVMDGFIKQENYESVLGLFKIIVDYVNRATCPLRSNMDRKQISAVMAKMICTYNRMGEPECASYLFSYMLKEHEQFFTKQYIASQPRLQALVDQLDQLPEYIVENIRPSSSALNTLVRGFVDNGLLEQAYQFTRSSHDFHNRLLDMDGVVYRNETMRVKDEPNDPFNLIHSIHMANRFTHVIRGHVERGDHESALNVFQFMISEELKETQKQLSRSAIRPSTETIAVMAKSYVQYVSLPKALDFIKSNQQKYGIFVDISVYNEVFEGLINSGQHNLIQKLFDQLLSNRLTPQQPNLKTNEIIVSGYAQAGMLEDAERMLTFKHRIAPSYRPTAQSFDSLISQYLKTYNFEAALRALDTMMVSHVRPTEKIISQFYYAFVTQGSLSPGELEELVKQTIISIDNAQKRIILNEFIQSIRKLESLKSQHNHNPNELATILLDATMAKLQKHRDVAELHKTNLRMERVDRTRSTQVQLFPPKRGRNAKLRFAMKKSDEVKRLTRQRENDRLLEKQVKWSQKETSNVLNRD